MNKSNIKTYIWLVVGVTIVTWFLVLLAYDIDLTWSEEAIKKLPIVVTIEWFLWMLFTLWAWKWKIFQSWLIVEPIIQGTWKGKLITSWVDPETGSRSEPIPIVLTIKQTFYDISCTLYTNESTSSSYSGKVYYDTPSGLKNLIYTYTNKPKASIRDRSEFHDGTANLRIVGKDQKKMEGDYWTTRKTTGDITLEFFSKKLVTCFSDAE